MVRRQEESQEGEVLHQSNSLFNIHSVIITGLLLPTALQMSYHKILFNHDSKHCSIFIYLLCSNIPAA